MAWQIAAYTRAKKLPRLDDLLRRISTATPDKRVQSWQEMKEVARAWTAHLRRGAPKKKE